MNKYNEEIAEDLISRIYEETQHTKPSLVAESYDIDVRKESLPCTVFAIYTMIGERSFIVLNESDTEDMHEYATALALYYHFKGISRILLRDGPADGDFSAAHFAYALVTRSESMEHLERFVIPDEIERKGKGMLN